MSSLHLTTSPRVHPGPMRLLIGLLENKQQAEGSILISEALRLYWGRREVVG